MIRVEGHEKTYIPSSRPWECGNPEGISKEYGELGKPASWLPKLFILCHFHGLLFARQVLEIPMCRHPVQYAALGARCLLAPHRLSLSALAIRLLIEATSQVIDLSELPVIRPCERDL
jgi:hypothetical protein